MNVLPLTMSIKLIYLNFTSAIHCNIMRIVRQKCELMIVNNVITLCTAHENNVECYSKTKWDAQNNGRDVMDKIRMQRLHIIMNLVQLYGLITL